MDQTKECWQKNRGAEVTTPSNGFFGNPLSGRDRRFRREAFLNWANCETRIRNEIESAWEHGRSEASFNVKG